MKLVPLDKYGWPVERIIGRPVTNAIRLALHTRAVISEVEWKRREAEMHRRWALRAPCVLQGPCLG
jgi:hypothetical protein